MSAALQQRIAVLIKAHQVDLAIYRTHKNCACGACRVARRLLRLYDRMKGA